ncbi:hypothetical protein SASPL_100700 [Salvia splendens]|uniref:F-box associated domain-containing protein n=1 Tax=Salvia splendens TaxID=180675 RepID=A0A8X9AB71_SALSN|nr:hypothetical protein SASPL_100700 [Salvia splendens]
MRIWYSNYYKFNLVDVTGAGPFGDRRSREVALALSSISGQEQWRGALGNEGQGKTVSTNETEYVAAVCSGIKQCGLGLRSMLADLGHQQNKVTRIFCEATCRAQNSTWSLHRGLIFWRMITLKDCLCFCERSSVYEMVIWLVKDYENEKSWTKEFVIPLNSGGVKFIYIQRFWKW